MADDFGLAAFLAVPIVIFSFRPGWMVLGFLMPLALAMAAVVVLCFLAIELSVSPLRTVYVMVLTLAGMVRFWPTLIRFGLAMPLWAASAVVLRPYSVSYTHLTLPTILLV